MRSAPALEGNRYRYTPSASDGGRNGLRLHGLYDPVATPPNAIVFGSQCIRMVDMVCIGVLINLFGVLLITLFAWFFAPLVFGLVLGLLAVVFLVYRRRVR